MPTETKLRVVDELAETFGKASAAVAADFSGLSVNQMTDLRRRLRETGGEFRVVKNRLALLAAERIGSDTYPQLLEGVTGIAFGYGDPVPLAKVLDEYVKQTRAPLRVRSAIIDGRIYTATQVGALASVPPREELLARLMGQMNAPASRLVGVLQGTIRQFATVLQRRAEQIGAAG